MSEAAAPIPVLHEDESLIAVDKPSGMFVHRTALGPDRRVLVKVLGDQIGRRLFPVHRLDRATSGVILFGFSSEAARAVHDALRAPSARKRYVAVVRGTTEPTFSSERPLTNRRTGKKQEARTDFETLASFFRLSIVRATIHTGRQNQIRRHLSHLAHQVIGCTSYGKGKINQFFRDEYGLPRLCLHASDVTLEHPDSGEPITIRAPLADDLRAFLLRLPDVDRAVVESL